MRINSCSKTKNNGTFPDEGVSRLYFESKPILRNTKRQCYLRILCATTLYEITDSRIQLPKLQLYYGNGAATKIAASFVCDAKSYDDCKVTKKSVKCESRSLNRGFRTRTS